MFELLSKTPTEWAMVATKDMDALLLDHAACERKASAMGMSFVMKFADRHEIIEPLIAFAREELEHFQQVVRFIQKRNLTLPPDTPDLYATRIHKHLRDTRNERFLDRLLAAAVIEARGTERLALLAETVEDKELKSLYVRLTRAEDRHKDLFVDLARVYFSEEEIEARLKDFIRFEDEAISDIPFRSAIH